MSRSNRSPHQGENPGGRERGYRSLIAAVLANLGISVAKVIAFAFTGSTSMLAEAVHSIADTAKQALLFVGRARARRKADPEHLSVTVRSDISGR